MNEKPPKRLGTFQAGPGMTLLAIVCWFLSVAQELGSTCRYLLAVLWLPRGRTQIQSGEEKVEIKTISYRRLVLCILVALVRLTMCGMLLYAGTLYLVGTVDMRDLLLNSVALVVVLDVDELVFGALAPESAREAIECADPMCYSLIPRYYGVDVKAILLTVLVLGGIPVVYFLNVVPSQQILHDASENACSGEKEFAYATNVLGIVAVVKTRPWDYLGQPLVRKAVQEAKNSLTANTSDWAIWAPDYDTDALIQWKSASASQALQLLQAGPSSCQDLINKGNDGRVLANWLGNLHGRSYSSCSQLQSACLNINVSKPTDLGFASLKATQARAVCPQTCGCDSRMSVGIFSLKSDFTGCAGACRNNIQDKYNQKTCEDSTPAKYQNKKGWDMIVEYMRSTAATSSPNNTMWVNMTNWLNTSVCDGVRWIQIVYRLVNWNPCIDGWGIPITVDSVMNHCPVACGCLTPNVNNGCPFECTLVKQAQAKRDTP